MKFIEGEHFSDELTRDKFIRDMNNLIAETRQTAIRLFDVFNNAHNTLSSYHFEQFVNAIDLEKSTVNKMKKICSSRVVTTNLNVLPSSWGTLYVIAGMNERVVQSLVEGNKFNKKTTRTEVYDIRDKVMNTTSIQDDPYDNLVDNSPKTHWTDMPDFSNDENDEEVYYHELVVRFKSERDFKMFQQLIGQSLTKKNKNTRFPLNDPLGN